MPCRRLTQKDGQNKNRKKTDREIKPKLTSKMESEITKEEKENQTKNILGAL